MNVFCASKVKLNWCLELVKIIQLENNWKKSVTYHTTYEGEHKKVMYTTLWEKGSRSIDNDMITSPKNKYIINTVAQVIY